jgi:hypothetical protein
MRPVAEALQRQAGALAERRGRFAAFHDLIDSKHNLPLETWEPLFAIVVDYAPDLILELGRGRGNSTALFVEAAHEIGAEVVSIGFEGGDESWAGHTRPRLEPLVGPDWFTPLTALDQDIVDTDFDEVIDDHRRVFLFWDAHGAELADTLFERLVSILPADNQIVVHDVGDASEGTFDVVAGPLGSMFDEITVIWDRIERRGLDYATDFCLRFVAR